MVQFVGGNGPKQVLYVEEGGMIIENIGRSRYLFKNEIQRLEIALSLVENVLVETHQIRAAILCLNSAIAEAKANDEKFQAQRAREKRAKALARKLYAAAYKLDQYNTGNLPVEYERMAEMLIDEEDEKKK